MYTEWICKGWNIWLNTYRTKKIKTYTYINEYTKNEYVKNKKMNELMYKEYINERTKNEYVKNKNMNEYIWMN